MSVFQKGITTSSIHSANLLMNVSKSFGLHINGSNVLILDTSGNTTVGSSYQSTNVNASRLSLLSNRICASVNGYNVLDADSTHTKLGNTFKSTVIDGPNFHVTDTGIVTGSTFVGSTVNSQIVNTNTISTIGGTLSIGSATANPPTFDDNSSRITTTEWVRNHVSTMTGTIIERGYATTTSVNTSLQNYATTTSVNASLQNYATTTSVNTSLQNYATTTSVNTSLQHYATTTSVNTSLQNYVTTNYLTQQGYVIGNSPSILLGNNSGTIQLNGTTTCSSTLSAVTFNATSDKRLKTNIVDLNRDESLKIVRQLKPKIYDFKTRVSDSLVDQVGFIAQDIKEIEMLTPAVNMCKGFIPNLNCAVTCEQGSFMIEFPLKMYDRIQYIQENQSNIATVSSYEEGVVQLDIPVTGEVYLYGTEIEDLHSIQKDMIYTLAVSALQRLDEMVTQQQKTIDYLLQRISTLDRI
jgi:hypothetical protein